MPSPTERSIVLRRFDGVNLLVDQAYLGPSYLVQANNWIPGNTFRLTKMPGNLPYAGGKVPTSTRVLKMIRTYDAAGNAYLYIVSTPAGVGPDQLWVSVSDGAFTRVQLTGGGNADFTERAAIYDMAVLNQILYVGNGVDPIYAIPVGGTAETLTAITSFTDGSAAPTLVVATAASNTETQMLTGAYAYAWAIFDHQTTKWVERGQTRTVSIPDGTNNAISFPTPTGFASNGGTLSTRFRAHLFVAPLNLPIEFGHDQVTEGIATAGTFVVRQVEVKGPPLPLLGDARTGRIFRAHRGRLFIAGDQTNPTDTPSSGNNNAQSTQAVWATYLAVPGLEQSVFNAGLFFPYNARTPRTFAEITALGIADTGGDDPEAPLIVCTLDSTYLFYGDILDDPNARWMRVSRTIGCINKDTMVETPVGTIFVGLKSVYMIPPGGGPPVDIGWPIQPSIQDIPTNSRTQCTAIYHKGFYKLAIVQSGGTQATTQWWLDLRNGLGRVPSWWGPHRRVAVSAWCTGQQDEDEADRGYMAIDNGGLPPRAQGAVWNQDQWNTSEWDHTSAGAQWNVDHWNTSEWETAHRVTIELIHQIGATSEFDSTVTLVSVLQTGDLDDGDPFMRKMFTRIRVTLFPGAATTLSAGVSVDGGAVGPFDNMSVPAPEGAQWNVDQWNSASWAAKVIAEGETVSPENRPRGRTASVQIVHAQSVALSMRDFELRYLPVARPVRLLSNDSVS